MHGEACSHIQSGPANLWCAGRVVVPKKSGDVRICIDLKPLNESVLR